MKALAIFTFMLACGQLFASSEIEEIRALEPPKTNMQGFLDLSFKNDYMTPRGLLVTDTGLTTQVIVGLSLDLYKNPEPKAFLNKMAITGFIWNDLWSHQHNHFVNSWNECDWGAGVSFTCLEDFTVGGQYLEFLSPPHNFKAEKNIEFLVAYDDSRWKWPVVFNPYVKWFWAVSGDSTVVVGKRGKTFDVELGLIPTKKAFGVVISAPTWLTVGPAQFWNGGKLGLKDKRSNFGVFSTGLQCEVPISYIPHRFGDWYLRFGVQYYHLINDSLLEAQTVTLGLRSRDHAHRNVYVASAGFGCTF